MPFNRKSSASTPSGILILLVVCSGCSAFSYFDARCHNLQTPAITGMKSNTDKDSWAYVLCSKIHSNELCECEHFNEGSSGASFERCSTKCFDVDAQRSSIREGNSIDNKEAGQRSLSHRIFSGHASPETHTHFLKKPIVDQHSLGYIQKRGRTRAKSFNNAGILGEMNQQLCIQVCDHCKSLLSLRWGALCTNQCHGGGRILTACLTLWAAKHAPQDEEAQ